MKKLLSALILLSATSTAMAESEVYKIDSAHSFANWSIRHVVSKASGTFSDVTGQVNIDRENLENSSIQAKISVLSVNSSHAKRDKHIKTEKFLDADKYAEMTFVSKKIEAKSKTKGVVTGDFTMHGVTKTISFPFEVLGFGADPWGGFRMGLEAHTKIKASDYGFAWGLKPAGSLGDDIEVTLLIEGIKSK